jgi:hypothetical protein
MVDFTPDAVMAPLSYAGSGDAATRLARLHAEFSAILKVPRVYVRHQGTTHFVSGSPADTLLFPQSDPRSGRPRYAWSDRGDGVSYGRLQVDNA